MVLQGLYIKSKIIIFDEATNAIDAQTEKQLISEMTKQFYDRSMVFVTHKQIPFKSFNKIYQIENKKIEIV